MKDFDDLILYYCRSACVDVHVRAPLADGTLESMCRRWTGMLSGMDLIKAYRANPDHYLPMIDHTEEVPGRNEYGEYNIGWNAGLLDATRPYFVECWAVDQITMLTIYVSAEGIEEKTAAELDQWLQDVGYFSYLDKKYWPAEVKTFENQDGNEFFAISITVGIEDEPALITGAQILSWSKLNEYNRKTTE